MWTLSTWTGTSPFRWARRPGQGPRNHARAPGRSALQMVQTRYRHRCGALVGQGRIEEALVRDRTPESEVVRHHLEVELRIHRHAARQARDRPGAVGDGIEQSARTSPPMSAVPGDDVLRAVVGQARERSVRLEPARRRTMATAARRSRRTETRRRQCSASTDRSAASCGSSARPERRIRRPERSM